MTIKDTSILKITSLKWIALLVLGFQLLSSCTERTVTEPSNDLIGEWVVTETLLDIGNGSGEFEATDLNIILHFEEDQRLTGNGLLCGFSESTETLTGSYSIDKGTITATCDGRQFEHTFTLKNDELIISNSSCREPCRAKLIKK